MQVVTAPCTTVPTNWNVARKIFLAGGISGCNDWQATVIRAMSQLPDDVILINPRRPGNIDRRDRVVSGAQIRWEFRKLREADEVMFWFPGTSVCPITLFELGGALERVNQKVFVGCAPSYDRILDVEIQVEEANAESGRNIRIVNTLPNLIAQLIAA